MIAATACSILNKLFDLAPPALIGLAVDVVVRGQQSVLAGMGAATVSQQLWLLAGLTPNTLWCHWSEHVALLQCA